MHYLVKLIVEAPDRETALAAAESDADELVESGKFDWFTLTGRWGESQAFKIETEEAIEMLKDGLAAARDEFDEGMKVVKFMLANYTDDEIYNGTFDRSIAPEFMYLSRYQFARVSGDTTTAGIYANGNIWGGRVDTQKELDIIYKENKDNNRWVVPVDFHN